MAGESDGYSPEAPALQEKNLPLVSVIVVVRNEEANIARCLSHIVRQDYPHDRLEIIVADGMSTDRTREIAESLWTGGVPLRVVENIGQGRTQGLNLAIGAARGDVIARVDARTVIPPGYLRGCVETMMQTGADNVGGLQRPLPSGDGLTRQAIAMVLLHPAGVGGAEFRLGRRSGDVDTVYLGCFRRGVFEKVGLFDEKVPIISEDADINFRIRQAGGRVYLNSELVAYYDPRHNFLEFWRLYVRYGGGKAGFMLKHRRLAGPRQLALALFIGSLILLTVASPFSSLCRIGLVGLLGVYVMGNLFVSGMLALRASRLALFPYLALALACIHFGWGFGFLRRLVQRARPGEYWKH